jgi:hypothetical protein
VFSPPHTPSSKQKVPDSNLLSLEDSIVSQDRPETPPPSTHRIENAGHTVASPTTPTPAPVHGDDGATLFDQLEQPPTPVLYNLIRNEGPPKFVIGRSNTPDDKMVEGDCDQHSMFPIISLYFKLSFLKLMRRRCR